jgi:hypothetical protein
MTTTELTRTTHTTREGWLLDAVALIDKAFFDDAGYTMPKKLAVSCGIPYGKASAIGQCWDPKVAADGTTHMFICPSMDEPVRVLDILLHEMIHAAVGIEEGHKGAFRKLVKEFGLMGKVTATYAEPGSECHRRLARIATELGPYPHKAMVKRTNKKEGKGGSGWIRLVSPQEEGYKLVISPKMIEEFGLPYDPWGNEMEPVQKG